MWRLGLVFVVACGGSAEPIVDGTYNLLLNDCNSPLFGDLTRTVVIDHGAVTISGGGGAAQNVQLTADTLDFMTTTTTYDGQAMVTQTYMFMLHENNGDLTGTAAFTYNGSSVCVYHVTTMP
jgi:hypothetical protein